MFRSFLHPGGGKSHQWTVHNQCREVASHHEYALMPCRSRIFVSCLISSGFNARRIASLFGSSECAVQALIGTEIGNVQRSKKDNPVSVDLFLHGFGRMKQFVQ